MNRYFLLVGQGNLGRRVANTRSPRHKQNILLFYCGKHILKAGIESQLLVPLNNIYVILLFSFWRDERACGHRVTNTRSLGSARA